MSKLLYSRVILSQSVRQITDRIPCIPHDLTGSSQMLYVVRVDGSHMRPVMRGDVTVAELQTQPSLCDDVLEHALARAILIVSREV